MIDLPKPTDPKPTPDWNVIDFEASCLDEGPPTRVIGVDRRNGAVLQMCRYPEYRKLRQLCRCNKYFRSSVSHEFRSQETSSSSHGARRVLVNTLT